MCLLHSSDAMDIAHRSTKTLAGALTKSTPANVILLDLLLLK